MRTLGTILQDERLKKGFSLEQVEKATKIRAKFLKSLEEDNFQGLPSLPYIQGFIRNYGEFLGLRSETMLAIFRRQYLRREIEKKQVIEEPLNHSSWQMTPNKVIITIVFILILGIIPYFYREYQKLHAPPPLIVESPKEKLLTPDATLPIFGDTDPDATLTINNEPVLVKEDGKFYKDITLSIGNNTIVIEAITRVGEKSSVTRMVIRTPH